MVTEKACPNCGLVQYYDEILGLLYCDSYIDSKLHCKKTKYIYEDLKTFEEILDGKELDTERY